MTTVYSEDETAFLGQLGNRIRELRMAKRFSQEQLAFNCNLDRTYIGSVERGERNISVLNLKKLSVSLDVPLPQLLNVQPRLS